jgi:hypothetical protein
MKAPVNRGLFPFPVGCVPTANHRANRKCISLEQYKMQKRAFFYRLKKFKLKIGFQHIFFIKTENMLRCFFGSINNPV